MARKIWILEKFITPEAMEKHVKEMEDLKLHIEETTDDADTIKTANKMLNDARQTLENNPNGHWTGWAGKLNYKEFCRQAKECINFDPTAKYRVLKADEIDSNHQFWCGNYTNGIENEGVLRYLYATR